MRLLRRGSGRCNSPSSWLPPPPAPPEAADAMATDWNESGTRRGSARRRSLTTESDMLPTSTCCRSDVQVASQVQVSATMSSVALPDMEERQPFPVYSPFLGPNTASGSLMTSSSSLAYELLASAATLSSLRHVIPFSSVLMTSSTSSYDIISAAAAALLRSQSPYCGGPFGVSPLSVSAASSLVQPEVDRVSAAADADSVLDLVVATSQSETPSDDSRRGPTIADNGRPDKLSRKTDDAGELSAKPRGCVWRPY